MMTRKDSMAEDLIDHLLGLTPAHPLHALRGRRPEARQHAEGAYRELLLPGDPGALSRAERAALAERVAAREGAGALAAHYAALVTQAGGVAPGPRLEALLRYADIVAATPEATSRADIEGMAALGLTSREIVAATQLIAFVPYQVRVLAALRAMMQESAQ
jgi:uncharacterized protein YciW